MYLYNRIPKRCPACESRLFSYTVTKVVHLDTVTHPDSVCWIEDGFGDVTCERCGWVALAQKDVTEECHQNELIDA